MSFRFLFSNCHLHFNLEIPLTLIYSNCLLHFGLPLPFSILHHHHHPPHTSLSKGNAGANIYILLSNTFVLYICIYIFTYIWWTIQPNLIYSWTYSYFSLTKHGLNYSYSFIKGDATSPARGGSPSRVPPGSPRFTSSQSSLKCLSCAFTLRLLFLQISISSFL